jgi:hypothetical protein
MGNKWRKWATMAKIDTKIGDTKMKTPLSKQSFVTRKDREIQGVVTGHGFPYTRLVGQ